MPWTFSRAALTYAGYGWRVLPLWWPGAVGACACGRPDCASIGKHPIHRLVPHGVHDATSRLTTVSRWWQSMPSANVGIRTGADSGLVVLDVDGLAGREALRGLVAVHGIFEAGWARTGSGGWHAYFGHPDTPVPSSAGRVGDRLDVRGEGGYVVAPPSRHRSGRSYRWIVRPADAVSSNGCRLTPIPSWLLDLALRRPLDDSRTSPIRLRISDAHIYTTVAVEHEAREVARAPAGQRNDRLNRAAFRLGQLVGAGLLNDAYATAALVS